MSWLSQHYWVIKMAQSDANLSQDSNDTQPNLSKGLGEMQISSQSIEQALDILSFEAENLNDVQQQETAISNVNLLRNLMRQTGVTPMMRSPEPPVGSTSAMNKNSSYSRGSGVGDAADRAMDVASRVQDLGFVEFTTGLINGTFDAIIGATIKQMEAYAALVADLAKTLSQFQAENVSDAEINAYLSDRYPDGAGGTSIRAISTPPTPTPPVPAYVFPATVADPATGIVAKNGHENFQSVVDALVLETSGLGLGNRLIREAIATLDPAPDPLPAKDLALSILAVTPESILANTPKEFNNVQVAKIRKAIGVMLASSMMDHLRAMAREGMARIVITEGSILTKLTFQVTSTDEQKIQQTNFRSNSLNANLNGSISGGKGKKRWGVAGGVSYSRVNVTMVDQTNTASNTTKTEMIGEVNIKFKTETFAPIVT